MRGRKKNEYLKSGRTIAAELEQPLAESERLQEHRRTHKRHVFSVLIVGILLCMVAGGVYLTFYHFYVANMGKEENVEPIVTYEPSVVIIDEDSNAAISTRTKEYIGKIERDFRDLGYEISKVTLPTGTTRELYVDLIGYELFIKVNMERGTAVSAEDAVRVLKYLEEKDLHPEYVDVRVEGKAYYK